METKTATPTSTFRPRFGKFGPLEDYTGAHVLTTQGRLAMIDSIYLKEIHLDQRIVVTLLRHFNGELLGEHALVSLRILREFKPQMALTTLSPSASSWIRAIGYRNGFLAIFADGFAWLVAEVPPTLPGLLVAGRVTAKDDGELSVGAAVWRLVLGKEYTRQKVEGEFELRQLRKMMDKEVKPEQT